MRKKLFSIIFSILFILSLTLVSSADSVVVDSMDFQGAAKEVSFAGAADIMLKDNASLKQELVNIEQAKISKDRLQDTDRGLAKALKDINDLAANKMLSQNKLNEEYLTSNAQRNYDCTVASLKSQLEQAYYGVLQAQQTMKINQDNVNVTKDLMEKTKKKLDLGLVAKQDVLSAEYNYTKALSDYNSAVNSLKKAKMGLNILLNYNVMDEVKINDELKYVEYKPGSIGDAVTKALANRNEIKAAQHRYDLQKITTDAEKGKNANSIDFKLETLNLEKTARDLDTTLKTIEKEVRSNYLDVLEKQEAVKTGQKQVDNTAESLKIAQTKYDTGMGVLTDVQSAQVAYMQAQLALSNSVLNYNLAISTFKDSITVGRTKQQ